MRKPSFGLCPEGASAIGFTAFSAIVFSLLECWPLALAFWVLCWFSLNFFRDPERVVPREKNVAVSCADGRVVKIERRPNPFDGAERLCVSVFMNVFNAHVNRAPLNCVVEDIKYIPGRFFNASLDKASEDNERCSWLFRDDAGEPWVMTQIAGLIARRIVARAEVGDRLARGERLGMIRFGSRVDLFLPESYAVTVAVNDKTLAGQTIIARKIAA